jgi:hypothetical protein
MTRRNRPIAGKCSAEKKGQKPNGLREGGKPAPVTAVRVRSYKDLDRTRVINHIAAELRIVTVCWARCSSLIARQQREPPGCAA